MSVVSTVDPRHIKICDNMMSRVTAAETARSRGLYAEAGYDPTSNCPGGRIPREIKIFAYYIGPKKGMYNRLVAESQQEVPSELRSRLLKARNISIASLCGSIAYITLFAIGGGMMATNCQPPHFYNEGKCHAAFGLMISGSILVVAQVVSCIFSCRLASQANNELLGLIRSAEKDILSVAMDNAKLHIRELNT